MKRVIKESELCKCDPMPHIDHQLCLSCKSKVPVSIYSPGFCNSTSWCLKCPKDSYGGRLRDMFNEPYEVEIKKGE